MRLPRLLPLFLVLMLVSCFSAQADSPPPGATHNVLENPPWSQAQEAIGVREAPPPRANEESVPGELIVKFKPSVSKAYGTATVATEGAVMLRHLLVPGYALVRVPVGQEEKFRAQLEANPTVELAERNGVMWTTFVPNDTFYSRQWHMPQVQMERAWDVANGSGVAVAVIDTGVAYENYADFVQAPDLAGTSFTTGYDFVNSDAHPNDDNGHGTHVAGTIAQTTNNSLGVAGVAYAATIMPIKVMNNAGGGTAVDVANGITWAVDHGADVINLSLGGGHFSIVENAVNHALSNGVVVVASAGNANSPSLYCPACYPGVIAVGATDYNRSRARYSSYGCGQDGHCLDVVAPGGDRTADENSDGYPDGVFQQTFEDTCNGMWPPVDLTSFVYCFFQGTSMASPHVAGAAALLLDANPTLTPQQVGDCLRDTALDRGAPGYDTEYGHGLIQIRDALDFCQVQPSAPTPPPTAPPLSTPNPQAYGNFGRSLAVGDVNGDGNADIAVGAPYEDADGNGSQGRAYVFSGADGSLLFTLDTPNPQAKAYFGWSLAVGDVNDDGKADIAVGAPYENAGGNGKQGRAYVFSGADGSLLFTLGTPNPQAKAYFGWSLAVGDVNGDGNADIAVGAPYEDADGNADQGQAYVFSGGDGSLLFTLGTPNPKANAYFGRSLALGDVNSDGKEDTAVGAPLEDVSGNSGQGRAYVFSGADGSLLFTLDTPNPRPVAEFGYSLAVGDTDGDGKEDIAVGSPTWSVGRWDQLGRAYVFSGADSSLLFTLDTPNRQEYGGFGWSLALGDVNGDGKEDIAVGAPWEYVNLGQVSDNQGRAYVFSGADGWLLFILDTSDSQANAYFGCSLALGDVGGDGKGDVAVGAYGEDVGGNTNQGRAYVFELAPADQDGDDVPDDSDNCPGVYNPGQEDSDGDGIGDACDGDSDADTIADALDNCPQVSNPDQTDTDLDDIGDACDDDDDDDGFDDEAEIYIGTDPCDNCPDDADDDAWPPDVNNDRGINSVDIMGYKSPIHGAYDPRYDLGIDGSVNIMDIMMFKPLVGMSCNP